MNSKKKKNTGKSENSHEINKMEKLKSQKDLLINWPFDKTYINQIGKVKWQIVLKSLLGGKNSRRTVHLSVILFIFNVFIAHTVSHLTPIC